MDDITRMGEIAEKRRREYQEYQPVFWRKAADSRRKHAGHLQQMIRNPEMIVLVAEVDEVIRGYLVGMLVPPPPVYAPGGPTCLIDDFAVATPEEWDTIGADLLQACAVEARMRGAVQTVVVCAHKDHARRAMLGAGGFEIASEWHVRSLAEGGP